MNKSVILSMAFAAVMSFCSLAANAQSLSPSTKWHWNKGKIMIESPERPAGQKDVLGLALPKMKTVRVGFVGLGMRGPSAVEDFCLIPGVEIVALCDYVEARAAKQNETLRTPYMILRAKELGWLLPPYITARRAMRICAAATISTLSI